MFLFLCGRVADHIIGLTMARTSLLLSVVCMMLLGGVHGYRLSKHGAKQAAKNPGQEVVQINGGFSVQRQARKAGTHRGSACAELQGDSLTQYLAMPHTSCKWTLKTNQDNQVLKITIEELDVGQSGDCSKNYLRLRDSDGETIDLCDRIPSSDHCSYTARGSEMMVEFVTDKEPALGRFKATIAAVDPGTTSTTCHRLLETPLQRLLDILEDRDTCYHHINDDGVSGTILSPNYPAPYSSYTDCSITITAPEWQLISFMAHDVAIELIPKCGYDYLRFTGLVESWPENRPDDTFCGDQFYGLRLLSEGNEVTMTFHTDQSTNAKGFQIQYEYYYAGSTPPFAPHPDYQGPNPECGDFPGGTISGGRIYGGEEAEANSWPHMVGIYITSRFQCGGAIITDKWILSAAHCFYPMNLTETGPVVTVTAGDHIRSQYDYSEQTVPVKRIIDHPNYDPLIYNDIALVELAVPLAFTSGVKPVCLAATTPPVGTECIATGWGSTDGPDNDALREVGLPLMSHDDCVRLYPASGVITDFMLCAGKEEGVIDTCKGDSGGPLMCKVNGGWCQVGVTSWGTGCGLEGSPGVYAKVSMFKDWLKTASNNDIDDSNFCG